MRNLLTTRWMALALCALGTAYGSLVVAACSGDDTVAATGDDGSAGDATADTGSHPSQDTGTQDTAQPPVDAKADSTPPNNCPGAVDAASLDDAMVQEGLAQVLNFHCYSCHQSTPLDAGLTLSGHNASLVPDGAIYPPNLSPDPDSGLGCWTIDQIAYTMLNAIDDQDASLCVMPKFSTRGMDASTAQAIATFLKTLPAAQNQVPDSVCPPPADAGSGG
jgi:hypothetical protein